MKFLIIRFSSMGDIVLTSPVVRALKSQMATAEIHYLTKRSYLQILEANPQIDKIHALDDNFDALISELRREDFDYILDLHHNLRTLRVKKALAKTSFSFPKLNWQKWLLTTFKLNILPKAHIVDRYMSVVKRFGVRLDGGGLEYFLDRKDEVDIADIPTSHLAGFIGLVIGAAHGTKKYPLHKLTAFCQGVRHPVMILGGPEDAARGQMLSAIDPFKIYNACGKFTFNQSADLVRRSKLIITNDTGLMHVAAAFKKPVISLWGNTVPEFGMYPYYGDNYLKHRSQPFDIMEVRELHCRPCSKIGYDECPLGHFKCMENIPVSELLEKTKARL